MKLRTLTTINILTILVGVATVAAFFLKMITFVEAAQTAGSLFTFIVLVQMFLVDAAKDE